MFYHSGDNRQWRFASCLDFAFSDIGRTVNYTFVKDSARYTVKEMRVRAQVDHLLCQGPALRIGCP